MSLVAEDRPLWWSQQHHLLEHKGFEWDARTPSPSEGKLATSIYFRPSFLPAERSAIDSQMRRSRVSGRLAV